MSKIAEAVDFILHAILTTDIAGREQTDEQLQERARAMRPDLLRASLYVSWRQAWGISANLNIDIRPSDDGGFGVTCEIGWPTTIYNAQTGRAAVDLHAAVVAMAEKIEKEFAA